MENQLQENLNKVKSTITDNKVTLVAVSKTKPQSSIETLYSIGQRKFGENRVEEMVEKYQNLPKDIEWHMIGHLQSKKVKKIAPFVSLIHSVDSFKLLAEINKHGEQNKRIIPCLLQFHVAQEESKYGLTLEEGLTIIHSPDFQLLSHIRIDGVMGMATFTEDKNILKKEFRQLVSISKEIKKTLPNAMEVSMGMSNDYILAIEEGSTIVRVGSTIFGARN